jgi:hypothetical protein
MLLNREGAGHYLVRRKKGAEYVALCGHNVIANGSYSLDFKNSLHPNAAD